jgi:hypothetical protein
MKQPLPPLRTESYEDGQLVETIYHFTLEEYVPLLVAHVKAWAGEILAATDWQTIKAFETGVPLPTDVAQARAAVRQISNYIESNALAASTPDELDAIPWAELLSGYDDTLDQLDPTQQ